jgi:hypothetical protein
MRDASDWGAAGVRSVIEVGVEKNLLYLLLVFKQGAHGERRVAGARSEATSRTR